jgi:tetratricopeptide (TPR) repeat protein
LVIARVETQDNLFAQAGERASPIARRFAVVVIEAALKTALTNQDYFARLTPFILDAVKRETQATHQAVAALRADVRSLIERFGESPLGRRARREIVGNRAFVVLARRINQEIDDPDQALTELTNMVELILQQKSDAERGTNLDGAVDAVLRRIADKASQGQFNLAAKEAESAFTDWESREADRRDAERETGLRLIQANIDQNVLRGDADAVADWTERRCALQQDGWIADADGLMDVGNEWFERGCQSGISFNFEVAAAFARRALPRCRNSQQRAMAQSHLGSALWSSGEQTGGHRHFQEAVAAYQAALEETAYEQDARARAATRNGLANALMSLATREGRLDRLEEAVEIYRAVLADKTCTEPRMRAQVQSNLGVALLSIGEQEGGTARLKEAVAVFRALLEEQTRDLDSLGWADTQSNLGATLQVLGEREPGTMWLSEAVAVHRAVLEERDRGLMPLRWAATQHNLGNALRTLGERETGTTRIEEAVKAYREALKEYTRDRHPISWACTMRGLGTVLRSLGEREGEPARLEEAVAAHRLALEVLTREGLPTEWAITMLDLACTNVTAAELTREVEALEEASKLTQEAREVFLNSGHEPMLQRANNLLTEIGRIRANLKGTG